MLSGISDWIGICWALAEEMPMNTNIVNQDLIYKYGAPWSDGC